MKIVLNNITCPKLIGKRDACAYVGPSKFKFNAVAATLLNLVPGDKIALEIEDKQLYMRIDPTNGIELTRFNSDKSFTITRASLAEALQKWMGLEKFYLKIGEFKEGRWPLNPDANALRAKNNKSTAKPKPYPVPET